MADGLGYLMKHLVSQAINHGIYIIKKFQDRNPALKAHIPEAVVLKTCIPQAYGFQPMP